MDNQAVKNYLAFFNHKHQTGGGSDFPVFKGGRYSQYGNGFGDILRPALRFLLPIAARGVTTFLSEAARGRGDGADWATAAKNAILPTANKVFKKVVKRVRKSQVGNGKRKRMSSKQYKRGKKLRTDYQNWNF